ncbi:MAG: hypothetical protein ACI9BS_000528, partial [Candidatus Poriferisodalaceae bacterium]
DGLFLGNATEAVRGFNIDTLPIGLDLIEARLNYAIGPHRIL